jgi:hypothetical protein
MVLHGCDVARNEYRYDSSQPEVIEPLQETSVEEGVETPIEVRHVAAFGGYLL